VSRPLFLPNSGRKRLSFSSHVKERGGAPVGVPSVTTLAWSVTRLNRSRPSSRPVLPETKKGARIAPDAPDVRLIVDQ
jgi:hypothetical protein